MNGFFGEIAGETGERTNRLDIGGYTWILIRSLNYINYIIIYTYIASSFQSDL